MSPVDEDLSGRVATRFRESHRACAPPHAWTGIDGGRDVPDFFVPLSEGCSVMAESIEDVLGRTMTIVPASCRFQGAGARDATNRVAFQALLGDGHCITGQVVVNVASCDGMITAFAEVHLDTN